MRCLQRKARSGQTTAEYAIIVALVAVCSIAVITVFGDQLRALYGSMSRHLGGDTNSQVQVIDPTSVQHGGIGQFPSQQ